MNLFVEKIVFVNTILISKRQTVDAEAQRQSDSRRADKLSQPSFPRSLRKNPLYANRGWAFYRVNWVRQNWVRVSPKSFQIRHSWERNSVRRLFARIRNKGGRSRGLTADVRRVGVTSWFFNSKDSSLVEKWSLCNLWFGQSRKRSSHRVFSKAHFQNFTFSWLKAAVRTIEEADFPIDKAIRGVSSDLRPSNLDKPGRSHDRYHP